MRRSRIVGALVAVLVTITLLAGCGGGKTITPTAGPSPEKTSPVATPRPSTPVTPEPTQTKSGDTLSEILGRAQNVTSLKYTLVITQPGVPAISTVTWVKKNKMRMEMSFQGIAAIGLVDLDAQTMYTYIPSQNIAVKTSVDQASKPATQEVSSIADYNPKNLGTESINGVVCYILEYNFEGNVSKMWISQDRGLPVKVEQTTTEGKTISEFKDYDFSDIPDSMFELPAGVQIM
ncbi:MAG: DUF4412 domain-containing protein [Chloroflexota bacterium]